MVLSGTYRPLRALASLLALVTFLGASWSEARALEPCPHHDALSAHMPGMAGMADMPGMIGMAGQHGQTDPGPPGHPETHGPCKCMGCCAAGATPALTVGRPTVALAVPPVDVSFPPAPPQTRTAHRATDVWSRYPPTAPPLSA
jgi:hypothetical protein